MCLLTSLVLFLHVIPTNSKSLLNSSTIKTQMANKTSKNVLKSQKSDLPHFCAPSNIPSPLVFKCIPIKELKVDIKDSYALFKYTFQQVLQAVEEVAWLYLAGTIVRGLALQRYTYTISAAKTW